MKRWKLAAALTVVMLSHGAAAQAAPEPPSRQVEKQWASMAGITPDSRLYWLDRALEGLLLAAARTDERRAALQAGFALERASEAGVMTRRDREALAVKAATEAGETGAAALANLHRAIAASDRPVRSAQRVMEAEEHSRVVLGQVLERAPVPAESGLRRALEAQSSSAAAVAEFQSARQAFTSLRRQVDEARQALAGARRDGDAAGMLAAEGRVKALADRQGEVEHLQAQSERAEDRASRELAQSAQAFAAPRKGEPSPGKPEPKR